MRLTFAVNPCIGGRKPDFAERIVFGAIHSAGVAMAFRWLSRRIRMAAAMLEAQDGLAGKALARAAVRRRAGGSLVRARIQPM